MIEKKFYDRTLSLIILFAIFSISFRLYALTILLSLLSIVFIFKKFKYNRRFITSIFFVFLFFIFYLFFGINNGVLTDSIDKFILKQMLFISSGFLFFLLPAFRDNEFKILEKFLILSLIYYYSIVIYSYYNGFVGYNDIYNPFINEEINSPLIALLGTLSAISLVDINQMKGKNKLFNIVLIVSILYLSGIYLGSRASLFLILIYITLRFSKLVIYSISIVLPILLIVYLTSNINFGDVLDVGGFASRGLQSSRFGMYTYGFSHMWDFPFGGLKVLSHTYSGSWFHNMFLDIIRVAGFTTMFYWVFILLSTTVIIVYNKLYKGIKTFGLLFIIYILALSQDLAFDGQYNIMCIVFFIIGYNVYNLVTIKEHD
ncbi:hypothetical protein [Photobacterium angustum]|uniref:Uncharacterized protein n=1 Tax=Photobacterium angustum TaxID=661 RepID=A0A2S7VWK8_PHOAN|nr:hypothetical protein [Photobacterium angustum]PQJ66265.1 hypothetical protein BTO08_01945 [Photobacterium angustum]